ncbi:nucleoside 2-deoxyribosyltransferase [candidate division KSB1 bacterium]|nr:nucleoside 2-deoxyribosyltransferase [candidate division KSB1 bacterium]
MHLHVPDYNRLKTALLRGTPDRVPLFELAIAKSIKKEILGKDIVTLQDEIDFAVKSGYDYIKMSPLVNMNPGKTIPKEGRRVSAASDHVNEREWHASGKGMVTSMEDFETFRWPQKEEVDYSHFEKVQPYLPDGMKIVAQYGDIFTFTWDFMGFETFSFALVDNPELVRLVFDKIGSLIFNMFENMASVPNVGALYYTDDIAINTGLFVSPSVYREYLFPWMKKISQLCKRYDLQFIYHSDGNLHEVFEDLIGCGIDGLHPIEPQAMDIRELKNTLGDKLCLIGNVDVDILSRGRPEEIREVVLGLLRDVAPGGGYCLGSGNSVPEYVPAENFRAMAETALQCGRYPIVI